MAAYVQAMAVLLLPPVLLLAYFSSVDRVAALLFSCLIAGFLGWSLLQRAWAWRRAVLTVQELAYAGFFLLLLLATLVARARLPELGRAVQFHGILMLFLWTSAILFLPSLLRTTRDVNVFIRTFDVLAILVTLTVFLPLAGVQFGEIQSESSSGLTRVFGPFGDSVGILLALFACRALVAGWWLRLAFFMVALLLTGGIGATLTLCAALATHFLLPSASPGTQRSLRKRLLMLVGLCVIGSVVVLLAGSAIIMRLSSPEMMAFTLDSRLGAFKLAVDTIRAHPFAGVGFNGFGAYGALLNPEIYFNNFNPLFISNAQNQLLQTATDAGVIGILAFLLLIILIIRALFRLSREGCKHAAFFRAGGVWLVGLMLGNQSAVWMVPYSLPVYVLFCIAGVALAVNLTKLRSRNSQ